MAFLLKNGSTKYQKIVAAPLSIIVLGALIPAILHDFVSNKIVLSYSNIASIFLTAAFITLIAFLRAKELWRPDPAWYQASFFIKTLTIFLAPFILFGALWVNIEISLPYVFTLAFGTETTRQETIIKEHSNSRRSCNHKLKITSSRAPLFYYCISDTHYNQLPNSEITAELFIQESTLGYIVNNIKPSS